MLGLWKLFFHAESKNGSKRSLASEFLFSCSRMKLIAFIFIDLIQIPQSNAGGHLAHLGGALWGYVYQRQFLKGNDIGAWFMRLVSSFQRILRPTNKPKQPKRRKRPATASNSVDQKKVDAILDKIAASGYESLTKAEKEYLFRAGKQ